MTFQDLVISECYTMGDDAYYKVIAKGNDWICMLVYSFNHQNCSPVFWKSDDEFIERLELYDDCSYIFDELKYRDNFTLSSF